MTQTKDPLSKYSPLTQTLLTNRGITTPEDVQAFLFPDWDKHTHDPFEMAGMKQAVERILQALENNESIVIYSDYDTDGVPGAVILHDFFKKIGYGNFEVYIPHRVIEGFGLNTQAIDEFIQKKVDLLITIDCGIRGNGEVEKAQQNGIDVIITDHHLPSDTPPQAYAIVNPKMPGCSYKEEMLCGAGVIFKMVQALVGAYREKHDAEDMLPQGWEKWLLDMAGIATLSDMVPLRGENRVLAHYGLTVLRKSRRPGLKKLLERSRISQKYLSEEDVGFTIGPRINAASRMGVPMDAFKLLASDNEAEAEKLAKHLEGINNERKGKVASIVKEVKKKLDGQEEHPPIITTGNPHWSPSLMGLVAQSVVGAYKRPAFIWGRGESSVIKGSCRSDGTIDLVELMQHVPSGFFLEFGGHAASGGFAIDHEHIHTLPDVLEEAYAHTEKHIQDETQTPDAPLTLADITWDLWDEISKLAPFGMGNPKPLFAFDAVSIAAITHFGRDQNHLKITLQDEEGNKIDAIEFFKTKDDFDITEGDIKTVFAHLEKNTFGYRPELRLRLVDIR